MVHWHQPLAIACLMLSGSARGLGWDGGAVGSDDWVDSDDLELDLSSAAPSMAPSQASSESPSQVPGASPSQAPSVVPSHEQSSDYDSESSDLGMPPPCPPHTLSSRYGRPWCATS
jgi:hypothetical protein